MRLLRADEIECRISAVGSWGVQLLLYKDARCDMNILDEEFGPRNWQRKHELINGNLFCSVGVFDHEEGMWTWKQDVGVESYTEKEKGQASDAFKRACFNWGIGRELYTAPQMFVKAASLKTLKQDDKGKWTCKDYFTVLSVDYDGRRIAAVTVVNEKTGEKIMFGTPPVFNTPASETIGQDKVSTLELLCKTKGVAVEKLLERYKVNTLEKLTEDQYLKAVKALEKS